MHGQSIGLLILAGTACLITSACTHRTRNEMLEANMFRMRNAENMTTQERLDSLHAMDTARVGDRSHVVAEVDLLESPCSCWDVHKLPEEVNTSGDEYAAVPIDDTTLFFTRANHATCLCYSGDIFLATIHDGRARSWNIGRPTNDCHENSVTDYNARTNTALVYSQYYTLFSRLPLKFVWTASYPNDVATMSTVRYVYDVVADYYDPRLPEPKVTAEFKELSSSAYETAMRDMRATTIIDNSGDLYRVKVADLHVVGLPRRIENGVSTENWESDAVVNDALGSLFFTSDRPTGMHAYRPKKPYRLGTQSESWGNTDIFFTRIADSSTTKIMSIDPTINSSYAERTPAFTASGDTMYFSSNGFPGFGGMDVYMSRHVLSNNAEGWTSPINLGLGLNSTRDELWFRPWGSGQYVFSRRDADGMNIYTATRTARAREVRVDGVCDRSRTITVAYYNAHHEQTSTSEIERAHTVTTPDLADYIGLKTADMSTMRVYSRCLSTSDTLMIDEADLRTADCGEGSASTNEHHALLTIRVEEMPWSISKVFEQIVHTMQPALNTTAPVTITVNALPAHARLLAALLKQHVPTAPSITISTTVATGSRSTIEWRW